MAGMKRFVTYIYSYEDKKKGSNIGFAKIEIRGEDCRIEIHLRGVYAVQSACRVYLFRAAEGEIEGILIGNMKLGNGNGDFAAIVKAAKIGDTPFGIADLEGIFLLTEDERIFMSRWKEGAPLEVSQEHFHEWRQPQPGSTEAADKSAQTRTAETSDGNAQPGRAEAPDGSAQQKRVEPADRNAQAGRMEAPGRSIQRRRAAEGQRRAETQGAGRLPRAVNDASAVRRSAPSTPDAAGIAARATAEEQNGAEPKMASEVYHGPDSTGNAAARGNEENVQATEIPMRNVFPEYDWRLVWENLKQNHPVFAPLENRETECIQIELKDLRELPKRYWYLGNNSFLLHGFFNYRYLIIGKTPEERWFLGVPGVYQRQERVMAAIFGFPEFSPAASEEVSGEEVGEPVNRFGWWFRYIEE